MKVETTERGHSILLGVKQVSERREKKRVEAEEFDLC